MLAPTLILPLALASPFDARGGGDSTPSRFVEPAVPGSRHTGPLVLAGLATLAALGARRRT